MPITCMSTNHKFLHEIYYTIYISGLALDLGFIAQASQQTNFSHVHVSGKSGLPVPEASFI